MAAVALGYFAYNFIEIHRTLRVTPPMAAGVTDRLWDVEGLVVAWEASERRAETGRVSGAIDCKTARRFNEPSLYLATTYLRRLRVASPASPNPNRDTADGSGERTVAVYVASPVIELITNEP